MPDVVRAVIDTNIWVAAFVCTPGPAFRIGNAALAREFVLVNSEPLLAELLDVLARPRIALRHRHTMEQISEFVTDLLRAVSSLVSVSRTSQGCRDPKDDMVVETALAGNADLLVTQDSDFQGSPEVVAALNQAGTLILTPSQFVQVLSLLS